LSIKDPVQSALQNTNLNDETLNDREKGEDHSEGQPLRIVLTTRLHRFIGHGLVCIGLSYKSNLYFMSSITKSIVQLFGTQHRCISIENFVDVKRHGVDNTYCSS
jgi:hypothetical protein